MRLAPRKADLKQMIELMDSGEYETAEDLAAAVWDQAWESIQERGRYTVVGQLRFSLHHGGYLNADDARASKVCLGLFATEGDAQRAAESLSYSATTGEEFKTWVLPVEHQSPAEVYTVRKEMHRQAREDARKRAPRPEEEVA